ncbi:hypothetical protein Acy02nite_67330 [Actinoplanes cyaneus]|uniref:Uncharacterized protein n=1 Tax=Actinoplanes cyaneus TaxID=52696 RepID=A0A919IR06_9ACTN|nr:hypothetical protein Acy02nite_67330 [Actinoplanes cyaneus]
MSTSRGPGSRAVLSPGDFPRIHPGRPEVIRVRCDWTVGERGRQSSYREQAGDYRTGSYRDCPR